MQGGTFDFYIISQISFLIGLVSFFLCVYFFPKIGLLDFPHRYNLTRSPIPYPAGIMIVLSFLCSVFLFFPFENSEYTHKLFAVLSSLIVITIISFIDDRYQLSSVFRLFIQIFVAIYLVLNGIYIEFLTNPFSQIAFHFSLLIGGAITVFWIVGCMNAINWLDGVPNLSVTSGAISSLVIGFLSLSPFVNQQEIAIMAFCFFGTLLPFIIGNLGKTRYILGDSGSMAIGFLLAVFSVFSGGKMATMFVSMSIPVFDSIFVFVIRILQKKSPLQGKDSLHLHDQLVLYGWKNWYILAFYLTISLSLGLSVLFLETTGKILLIFSFGFLFFLFRYLALSTIDKDRIKKR